MLSAAQVARTLKEMSYKCAGPDGVDFLFLLHFSQNVSLSWLGATNQVIRRSLPADSPLARRRRCSSRSPRPRRWPRIRPSTGPSPSCPACPGTAQAPGPPLPGTARRRRSRPSTTPAHLDQTGPSTRSRLASRHGGVHSSQLSCSTSSRQQPRSLSPRRPDTWPCWTSPVLR